MSELKLNLESLSKENDLDKFLPQILNIFTDLPMHWSSLNNESKRSFNNLIFPEGFSYTLKEKITIPQMSKPFNVYSKKIDQVGNLVDYISKNWNTNYSFLLKFKEHLENAVYLPKNELNPKF